MHDMAINRYTLQCWSRGMLCNGGVQSTQVGKINYIQFIPEIAKSCLIKWLGQYIGKLIIGANPLDCNISFLLMISNEVMPYVNVLCSCMLDRVLCHLYSTFIVT